MSFKPLLAGHATEVIGFSVKGDLELGCFVVQQYTANWIFRHYPYPNLNGKYAFCLLSLSVCVHTAYLTERWREDIMRGSFSLTHGFFALARQESNTFSFEATRKALSRKDMNTDIVGFVCLRTR
jgi:hypothetical protein